MSNNIAERKYVPFWMNWLEFLQNAPDADKLCFIKVFTDYVLSGSVPSIKEFTPSMILSWPAIKARIDKDTRIFNRNYSNSRNAGAPRKNGIMAQDIIEAWNDATQGEMIRDITQQGWAAISKAWPNITSLSRFKRIVFRATHDLDLDRVDPIYDLFERQDYMAYLRE